MRIQLQGTRFYVDGQFQHFYTLVSIKRAITEAGGRYTESLNAIEVFVENPSSKQSYVHGLMLKLNRPIIDEQQLLQLLEDGELEIDFVPASERKGEVQIDRLLGEVRSTLSQQPGFDTWAQLVTWMDACTPEHAPMLMEYIRPHLQSWHVRDQALCLAPPHWAAAMMQGGDSAFYELIKWLDLSRLQITCTVVGKLLKHQRLKRLRRLDLPGHVVLNKTLGKMLVRGELLQDLEVLGLGLIKPGVSPVFDVPGAFPKLHTICVPKTYPYTALDRDEQHAWLRQSAFANVTRLINVGDGDSVLPAYGFDQSALPRLEHYECDQSCRAYFERDTRFDLQRAVPFLNNLPTRFVGRLKTLTINTYPTHEHMDGIKGIDLHRFSQLETLRVCVSRADIARTEQHDALNAMLPTDPLFYPGNIQRLVTNLSAELETCKKLAHALPHVEFVHEPFDVDY